MAVEQSANDLLHVVTLLGAAVIAVPLFKKIGLGSVLGYLCAGLVIGPFGLKFFTDSNSILHVAELGVVMFLFIIGLEMRPSHLWSMRKDIFGLGSLQLALCSILLTGVGLLLGFDPMVAFFGAMGFALTSTAIVMQILGERGDIGLPHGQKMVSVLLFEDLLIVPLLALVSVLSPAASAAGGFNFTTLLFPILALGILVASGIWLLNPLFRILALARAREVLAAAALLVVLGSALLMQMSGLSMALGAFLAGVLLSESSFRHQIEADIEPFRGILLGLFFIGVGMSLDLLSVVNNWQLILAGVLAFKASKALGVYVIARFLKSSHHESLDRAVTMSHGGEFAFVLYAAAANAGIISADVNANFSAIVVLSMVLTPIFAVLTKKLVKGPTASLEGVEEVRDLQSCALLIGFGRFGQVVSQLLLARNLDVTMIDSGPDTIRNAKNFGFKIYFGDGARLDVLRAAGAAKVCLIAICIDDKKAASRIVELVKSEFPQAKILARSYDRVHARDMVLAGVDYQIRETFESAINFGEQALRMMEVPEEEVLAVSEDIRRRDKDRFEMQVATNTREAGVDLIHGNISKPAPLIEPQREAKILNPEEVH